MRSILKLMATICVLLCLVTQTQAQNFDNLVLVNYLDDQVTVAWTSTQLYQSTVTYRNLGGDVIGTTNDNAPSYVHFLTMTGLQAQTDYEYRASVLDSEGNVVESTDWLAFATAAEVLGDYLPHGLNGYVEFEGTNNAVIGALVLLQASVDGEDSPSNYLAAITGGAGTYTVEGMFLKNTDAYPGVFNSNGSSTNPFPNDSPAFLYTFDVNVLGGINGLGNETYSNLILEEQILMPGVFLPGPPNSVLDLDAEPGDQTIDLSWEYPDYDGASGEEGSFLVRYWLDVDPQTILGSFTISAVYGQDVYDSGQYSELLFTDLINESLYCFEVVFINMYGYESVSSQICETPFDDTSPNPVTNFIAMPLESSVILAWENPDGTVEPNLDLVGVKIYVLEQDQTVCNIDPLSTDLQPLAILTNGESQYMHNTGSREIQYWYVAFTFDDEALPVGLRPNHSAGECDDARPGDYCHTDMLKQFTALPVMGENSIDLSWVNPDSTDHLGSIILRKEVSLGGTVIEIDPVVIQIQDPIQPPPNPPYGPGCDPEGERVIFIDGFELVRGFDFSAVVGQYLEGTTVRVLAVVGDDIVQYLDSDGLVEGHVYHYVGIAFDDAFNEEENLAMPNFSDPVYDEMMANPHPDLDIYNTGFGGDVVGNLMEIEIQAGESATGTFLFINPHQLNPTFNPDPDPYGNEPLLNVHAPGVPVQLESASGQIISGIVTDLILTDQNDVEIDYLIGDRPIEATFSAPTTSATVGGIYEGQVYLQGTGKYSSVDSENFFDVRLVVSGSDESIAVTFGDNPVTVVNDVAVGTINIANTGSSDLYNLRVALDTEFGIIFPAGWETEFTPQQIPQLAWQQNMDADFSIDVPENFLAGDYSGLVRVEDEDNHLPWDTTLVTVNIPAAPAMVLDGDAIEIYADADNATYEDGTLVLENIGNTQIDGITFSGFTLTHEGGADPLTVQNFTVTVLPYTGSVNLNVAVTVPESAVEGEYSGTIIVTAPGVESVSFDVVVWVDNALEALNIVEDNLSGLAGDPGQTIEYTFDVENTGNADLDNIDIYATDWEFDVTFSPDPIDYLPWELNPNPVTVTAYITIPAGTAAGNYTGQFCAQDIDGTSSDCLNVELDVNSICGWELRDLPNATEPVTPNQSYNFTFRVCNIGNDQIVNIDVPNEVSFEPSGSEGDIEGTIDLVGFDGTLESLGCYTFTISVQIPQDQYSTTYTGNVVVSDGECGDATLPSLNFEFALEVAPTTGWLFDVSLIDFGSVDISDDNIQVASAVTITNTSNCDIMNIAVNMIQLRLEGCDTELTARILLDGNTDIPLGDSQSYDAIIVGEIPESACAGVYTSTSNFQFTATACGTPLSNGTIGATVQVNADCNIDIVQNNLSFEMPHNDSDVESFTILNAGNNEVTVDLSYSGLSGDFDVQFSEDGITIPVGEQRSVTVTIGAPLGQSAEEGYSITIEASAGPGCTDDISGDIVVLPSTDIDVCVTSMQIDVVRGEEGTDEFSVFNPNSFDSNVCDSQDGPGNESLTDVESYEIVLVTTSDPVIQFVGSVVVEDLPTTLTQGQFVEPITVRATADEDEQSGEYQGEVRIVGTGSVSGDLVFDTFILTVVVESVPSLVLEGAPIQFEGNPGESINSAFTVRNEGNIRLTNITFGHTFSAIYGMTFDQSGFSLDPDGYQEITATVVIPMPDVACAGTTDGQINAACEQTVGLTAVNSAITINPYYAFDVSLSEGGLLSFVGSWDDGHQPNTQEIKIVNTGNISLDQFGSALKTSFNHSELNGVVFPSQSIQFENISNTDISCQGEDMVTVRVTIPSEQVSGVYEGSFEITESSVTGGSDNHIVNIRIEVRRAAALSANWTDSSGEGVPDGQRSKIGEIYVQNIGNAPLDDIVVFMSDGDGFKLDGYGETSIPKDNVTFDPVVFPLGIDGDLTVMVYADIPQKILNGSYVGVINVADQDTDAKVVVDAEFKVSDSRDFSVGPNPVRFPDFRDAIFYFKSGLVDEIQIYNMAADLIREATGLSSRSDWTWDLTNEDDEEVASGMYLCLMIKNGTVVKQIKLLVIKTED
ncbi:MAG: hypothetical protein B6244_03105 [Candidatus Cloacimonetes bacterium 4572_55]|nr:MAG: hypothetical protein B6244_03105 [Candidatus Cloacimonetes bacterium 4572_55]